MKKVLLILIPIFLIIAVAIGFLRARMQMSGLPMNSIKIIRQAVKEHDRETFYELVDVDAILGTAAEEILTAQINSTLAKTAYSTQQLSDAYENLKPQFISDTKAAVDDYISTGEINFPDNLTETQRQIKNSELDSCAIQSISKPVVNEGIARSKIEFYNADLKFSFDLEIELEKIDNSTWKIVRAKGFESYLTGLNRALQKKLEELNAPVRESIDEIFILKGFDAKVGEGDEYGFSRTLQLTIKADIQSEKPLEKIIGQIVIDGRDGEEGITPFEIDMVDRPQGEQIFDVDKVLNPFVQEDSDVMKHGLKRSAIHIRITEVDYLDGTNLKQLDDLPD